MAVVAKRRKKPGPKPSGKARHPLSVRLSPEEYALLERAAKRARTPISEFIRLAALRSAKRRK